MLFLLSIFFLSGFTVAGSFPKPLSKEKEYEYLELFNHGSEKEKEFVKKELIMHNLRLVAHIAKKYNNVPNEQEELISIGVIGLIKAIHSYDNKKSIRLATYACRCIENEILMFLRASKKFQNDISLYEPIGIDRDGNEIVMLDVINTDIVDFSDQLDFSIQTKKMLKYVNEILTEQEKKVIILRYGLWNQDIMTQQEIASQLGISRSYVSRIEKKALKKLNHALEE